MEKAAKNYPVSDFTVEGFEQIRKNINEIDDIDEKIDYIDYLIKKYEEQHSPFESPINVDISCLLKLERNFWTYINTLIKSTKIPENKDVDDLSWEIQFDENSNIKVDFKKHELFNFDIEKIIDHSKELGTLKNGLIYLRYVLKEFEIRTIIYPKDYLTQQMGGFKRDILREIKLIEDEINVYTNEVFNSKEKKSRYEPSLISKSRQEYNIEKFPSPDDLKWEEVTFEFITLDSIRVRARDIVRTYTYVQIGFLDRKRKNIWTSRWELLRDEFARFDGKIDWNTPIDQKWKQSLKNAVRDIRPLLKEFMGIKDDPFYPYKKIKGYKTKFKIKDCIPSHT